jgi:chromosome segregation ATPase
MHHSNTQKSPIPGAHEKIAALRQRHRRLQASIEHYEYLVAGQTAQLSKLNRTRDNFAEDEPEEEEEVEEEPARTEEDLLREEEEVRALEQKKRGLEDRVNSMGRDISGVLR